MIHRRMAQIFFMALTSATWLFFEWYSRACSSVILGLPYSIMHWIPELVFVWLMGLEFPKIPRIFTDIIIVSISTYSLFMGLFMFGLNLYALLMGSLTGLVFSSAFISGYAYKSWTMEKKEEEMRAHAS